VGAVIVRDGCVVGEGYHPEAGQPHAEIFALRQAGEKARGADLYVTLEPCSHYGRTPPCTEAVLAAGIARVFVGTQDPNPQVSGRGIRLLRVAGVGVQVGILEKECRHLIAPFAKHVTTGLPYVILKSAVTLDGKTATSSGDSQWISSVASREHVHRLRDRVDAVMVGIGTVLKDNPKLTTRLPGGGRDAMRIVVDSKLRIPEEAAVFSVDSEESTVIATTPLAAVEKMERLRARGAQILQIGEKEGQVDLSELMRRLGERGIQSILLEGGSGINASGLREGLVDRAMVFVAAMFIGGGDGKGIFTGQGVKHLGDAVKLSDVRVSSFGDDTLIEGEVRRCSPA
jgi:diaminohydroxyphosphoribosylaminopyrimidine deaminase/5-amino-6-(5-phosphoribosylamino)uracil reductase